MKEIPLTQGFVTQVDDEDYDHLSQFNWSYNGGYAVRGIPTPTGQGVRRLHQDLLNPKPGVFIDHVNHETLNNQRVNLRLCTASQNQQNSKRTAGKSGYRGVSWHKQQQRWWAQIRLNSKSIFLGLFDDPKIAAQAYDAAAKKYHGEFAILNFPELSGQLCAI